jgi:hypothetical protein
MHQAGTRQGAHRRAPARQLPQVVWLSADPGLPPQPDSKGGCLGGAARRHRQPSHKSSSRPCSAQHETKAGKPSYVAAIRLLKPPGSDKPVYGARGLALVPCPKQRHPWATVAHQGARGTLDEFKAAWVGCLAHHGGTPKILPGHLPPVAIADRWIGLQPYPSHRRSFLVCNLTDSIERHRVLQKV